MWRSYLDCNSITSHLNFSNWLSLLLLNLPQLRVNWLWQSQIFAKVDLDLDLLRLFSFFCNFQSLKLRKNGKGFMTVIPGLREREVSVQVCLEAVDWTWRNPHFCGLSTFCREMSTGDENSTELNLSCVANIHDFPFVLQDIPPDMLINLYQNYGPVFEEKVRHHMPQYLATTVGMCSRFLEEHFSKYLTEQGFDTLTEFRSGLWTHRNSTHPWQLFCLLYGTVHTSG